MAEDQIVYKSANQIKKENELKEATGQVESVGYQSSGRMKEKSQNIVSYLGEKASGLAKSIGERGNTPTRRAGSAFSMRATNTNLFNTEMPSFDPFGGRSSTRRHIRSRKRAKRRIIHRKIRNEFGEMESKLF